MGDGGDGGEDEDPLLRHYRYGKVAKVFDRLDVGGNGSISLAEYLTQVETLTPDEVAAARASFELLGPDKDGNVRKRKYIALQISAFEDVLDAEFDRWVQIMTSGSIVHRHRRKALEDAGVEVPDDFIEPPSNNVLRLLGRFAAQLGQRAHAYAFSASNRRRVAVYEMSAEARRKHIRRVQALQRRLHEHEKTLLDAEHQHAITRLEQRAKERGTLVAPAVRKEIKQRQQNGRTQRVSGGLADNQREEKTWELGPQRGLKEGNEPAPLLFEASDPRIRRSREIERAQHKRRIARDLVRDQAMPEAAPSDDDFMASL